MCTLAKFMLQRRSEQCQWVSLTFKKYGACEKAPIEECWDQTGTGPVGVKYVDANKGDKEKPEHRYRLVVQEVKKR